jgi:hypothetical protein
MSLDGPLVLVGSRARGRRPSWLTGMVLPGGPIRDARSEDTSLAAPLRLHPAPLMIFIRSLFKLQLLQARWQLSI